MGVDPSKRQQWRDFMVNELESLILEDDARGTVGRIPFKSPMMTWATTGGPKLGQVCRWYGPEGSGKTLNNWGIIYMAQNYPEIISAQYERQIKALEQQKGKGLAIRKRKNDLKKLLAMFPDGMSVALFDAEGRADFELAEQLGIRTKEIEVSYENIVENVCDGMAAAMEAFHLVILDSASNCESMEEAGLDPGKYAQASGPRAWSRLKRVHRAMQKNKGENTLIINDQMRSQLGRRMTTVEPPGVRIIKHWASLAANFSQGSKLYLDKNGDLTDDKDKASSNYPSLGMDKDGREAHGLELRCKIDKNSTGRPFRNARMRFRFTASNRDGEVVQEAGFDEAFELAEAAAEFNLVEANGNFYYRLDPLTHKRLPKNSAAGKSMNGNAQLRAAIEEDEEWAEIIRERLVAMT